MLTVDQLWEWARRSPYAVLRGPDGVALATRGAALDEPGWSLVASGEDALRLPLAIGAARRALGLWDPTGIELPC